MPEVMKSADHTLSNDVPALPVPRLGAPDPSRHRGHPHYAKRGHRRLGGDLQLLLLDRPGRRGGRSANDPGAAILRRRDRCRGAAQLEVAVYTHVGQRPRRSSRHADSLDAHQAGAPSRAYDLSVPSRVTLYLFSSGTLEVGGVEVPVPFFLIRHREGDVVVDGGNPLAVARDARAHWGALADQFRVRMTEEQHCVAQLRELGIAPGSVYSWFRPTFTSTTQAPSDTSPARRSSCRLESSMPRAPQSRRSSTDMSARTSISAHLNGEPSKANWTFSATGRSAYSRRRGTRQATCRCCFDWRRPVPSCSQRTPRTIVRNGRRATAARAPFTRSC